MKKAILFSLISGLALCSYAQLVVNPRGQLVAGKQTMSNSSTAISTPEESLMLKSVTTIKFKHI